MTPKPYEDEILKFLQQNSVVAKSFNASITLHDVLGDYTRQVVWAPATTNIDDIARTVAAGILVEDYKDHEGKAFRTVASNSRQ